MAVVYRIANKVNGKLYVGSTSDFARRRSQHLFRLRDGKHHSKHLQSAFDLYGEDSFGFEVIEECDDECVVEREQFWIDTLGVTDPKVGYNKAKTVGYNPGCPHTIETKRLMSEQRRGRVTDRQIAAIRKSAESRRGLSRPKEVGEKISIALAGHSVSEETRKKISEKVTGLKHTEETKRKIAAALTARSLSEETKAKISLFHKGRKRSEEHARRLSEANKGRFLGSERYNALSVVQCSLNGEVIAVFDSGASASRATGVANSSISKVIKGKLPHAGGYLWRRPTHEEMNMNDKTGEIDK